MKKRIINLICVMFIVSIFTFFIPNKVYGICNTIRFTKEVSAVKLTLSDGTILDDAIINKSVTTQTTILPNAYKNLNLIFIVKTEIEIEQTKAAITKLVNQIYNLYQGNAGKIKIGIIPFEDCSEEDIKNRGKIDLEKSILKNSKEEVLNEIKNLEKDNNQQLQETLMIAQNNFTNNRNGGNNDKLLQYIVLITDEIKNENVCTASNTILKDLSDNMVGVYGIFVGVNQNNNDNLKKLTDRVYELVAANDVTLTNIEYQLTTSVYQYISQFIIRESALIPSGGGKNMLLTPESIILYVDEELIHGAVLKIEYEMAVSRYAAYGNGEIYEAKIVDTKDPKLVFNKNEKLLTEPSKTNADYGWEVTQEGLVTNQKMNKIKLVLSTIITPEGLGNGRYSNTALCATSFDVGSGATARYRLSDKSLDVQILPPFGEENTEKEENTWIIYATIGIIFMIIVGVAITMKFRKKKK